MQNEQPKDINLKIIQSVYKNQIMQTIYTQLLQRYDKQFNFFFAKPVSEIVFNRSCSPATLDYKDIFVYSETNQYMKRTYHLKNTAGRNQIYDRIRMLAEFYDGAAMLKYEHPMMIISQTKDVFLKRLKRMKKMIASDCSSQESSSHKEQNSSMMKSFSSSRFLKSVKSSQLDSSSREQDSLINNCKKTEKSFDTQVHDIFDSQTLDFSNPEPHKDQIIMKKKLIQNRKNQIGIQHLIFDLDDVDKQTVLVQYKKIHDQQNIPMEKQKSKNNKQITTKKSSIIITALDHYTPEQKQSQSSGAYKYYPKNSKNMKKPPANYRYKQQYDETIRVNNYSNNLGSVRENYNSKNIISARQMPNNRSPSFGVTPQYDQGNSTERNTFGVNSTSMNPNIRNQNAQQQEARRNGGRQRIYTHGSYLRQNQSPIVSGSILLNLPGQNETIYLTHENSESSATKAHKKQFIRQKAVALLHKVKSQQKLPIYNQENGVSRSNYYKYHNKHRIGVGNYQYE